MPDGAFWPFLKFCGLAVIVGFICGTALAHIIIYARHFGRGSPIKGVSIGAMLLLIVLMIGVSSLFEDVTPFVGALYAVLIGLSSQIVGAVIGFAIRWSMGLGPPPPG
ncbi:MAG: hypothetical protein BA862_04425 [Desulfobulbaceae bacterium S3730MH12]|nr:MAG: hypothetical protein BA862_04425 [Desulfobulbaceae bacterium S3730MH12]